LNNASHISLSVNFFKSSKSFELSINLLLAHTLSAISSASLAHFSKAWSFIAFQTTFASLVDNLIPFLTLFTTELIKAFDVVNPFNTLTNVEG
jgi:hypothetical protein